MFSVQIDGDTRVTLRLEQFPTFAHDRLLVALQDIQERLKAAVLADEPNKTGALRNLTGGRVYDNGNRMAAAVGVRAENASQAMKAAALEYGSRGEAIAMRAHQMKLDHLWSRARSGPDVNVPAYSRTPNISAHNFLRGPIDAIRSDAIALLQSAIDQATKDAENA